MFSSYVRYLEPFHAFSGTAGHFFLFVFFYSTRPCCRNSFPLEKVLKFCLHAIQGDRGSHRQADGERLPPNREGRYSRDQAVHAQRRRGAHKREQTAAAARCDI